MFTCIPYLIASHPMARIHNQWLPSMVVLTNIQAAFGTLISNLKSDQHNTKLATITHSARTQAVFPVLLKHETKTLSFCLTNSAHLGLVFSAILGFPISSTNFPLPSRQLGELFLPPPSLTACEHSATSRQLSQQLRQLACEMQSTFLILNKVFIQSEILLRKKMRRCF